MDSNKLAEVQDMDRSQKNKALDLAVQAIEKQFGKGSIMRLGETENLVNQDIAAVPTGCLSLDIALGIG